MPRKITKKGLDRKALKLWGEKVIERAGSKCEYCGCTDRTLAPHHFYGKKNKSTRYDLENGIAVCYTHHVGGVQSFHESPSYMNSVFIERRGKKWYTNLTRRCNTQVKWNEAYIINKISELNGGITDTK